VPFFEFDDFFLCNGVYKNLDRSEGSGWLITRKAKSFRESPFLGPDRESWLARKGFSVDFGSVLANSCVETIAGSSLSQRERPFQCRLQSPEYPTAELNLFWLNIVILVIRGKSKLHIDLIRTLISWVS